MSNHSKLCASCKKGTVAFQSTIDTDADALPRWLRNYDYVQDFIENATSFRQNHPKSSTSAVKLQLPNQYVGRSVLFWAPRPRVGIKVPEAREAYGSFENSGVSYVKEDGSVILKFACPTVYKVIPFRKKTYVTFPRHVHWIVSNQEKTKWISPVYTTNMICGSSREQVARSIKSQTAFVVNALSKETHARMYIPGTCSMGHERIASMSKGRICNEVITKMRRQVPLLIRKAETMGVHYADLPIIVYCAHSECNAAKRLASHMMKAGFTNIYYYKEGVRGWYK